MGFNTAHSFFTAQVLIQHTCFYIFYLDYSCWIQLYPFYFLFSFHKVSYRICIWILWGLRLQCALFWLWSAIKESQQWNCIKRTEHNFLQMYYLKFCCPNCPDTYFSFFTLLTHKSNRASYITSVKVGFIITFRWQITAKQQLLALFMSSAAMCSILKHYYMLVLLNTLCKNRSENSGE